MGDNLFKDLISKLLKIRQHTKRKTDKPKIKVPVYLLDSTLIMPVFVRLGNISN